MLRTFLQVFIVYFAFHLQKVTAPAMGSDVHVTDTFVRTGNSAELQLPQRNSEKFRIFFLTQFYVMNIENIVNNHVFIFVGH